jgi:hypothetical protein
LILQIPAITSLVSLFANCPRALRATQGRELMKTLRLFLICIFAGLLCSAPAIFGQDFGSAIIGYATVCETNHYIQMGQGKIGPKEAAGVPCPDNSSMAIAKGSANTGPPANKAYAITQTTGDLGASSASSDWSDLVTFTAPTEYTNETATFKLHDDYGVKVTGPVPPGNIPATYCYQIESIRIRECANQSGDIEFQIIQVHRQFTLPINAAGVFQTQISINVGASAGPGGAYSVASEPADPDGITFTCPTAGWVYTMASMPNTSFVCQVTKE